MISIRQQKPSIGGENIAHFIIASASHIVQMVFVVCGMELQRLLSRDPIKNIKVAWFPVHVHGVELLATDRMAPGHPSVKYSQSEYRPTLDINRTLVCNKIIDHSHVVGASPVGAAPTTSSLSI